MYKILIKRLNTSKDLYQVYQVTDTTTQKLVDYSTDDLDELAETYEELIKTYPTSQLKPIEELSAEILVTIDDDTDE